MDRVLERGWSRLVAGKQEVIARVDRCPPEVRDRRPRADLWSMCDVVEHLVLSEGGMASALAKAPSPDRPRVVASGRWYRWPALRVALLGGLRFKAPVESILPRRELSWTELLGRWEKIRLDLGQWLEEAPAEVLGDPRFRHPIVGWLTVGQAVTFAGDHLEHHLAQIGRIARRVSRIEQ